MGQTHVNAVKRKTKDKFERLKIQKKPPPRSESQQALHPTATVEVSLPKCEGAFNGANKGSECSSPFILYLPSGRHGIFRYEEAV